MPFGVFSLTTKRMVGAENSGPSSILVTVRSTGIELHFNLASLSSASLRAVISSFTFGVFSQSKGWGKKRKGCFIKDKCVVMAL